MERGRDHKTATNAKSVITKHRCNRKEKENIGVDQLVTSMAGCEQTVALKSA
jgi:hypothetical protein